MRKNCAHLASNNVQRACSRLTARMYRLRNCRRYLVQHTQPNRRRQDLHARIRNLLHEVVRRRQHGRNVVDRYLLFLLVKDVHFIVMPVVDAVDEALVDVREGDVVAGLNKDGRDESSADVASAKVHRARFLLGCAHDRAVNSVR